MDFSTDTNGRIFSMNYTEIGGYSGELFVTYDNFGNLANLFDDNGTSKWATIYDLNNRYYDERHKVPDIIVPLGFNGKNEDITIQIGTDKDLIIDAEGRDFSITNPWGATDTIGWVRPPKTTKGGGDDVEPCGGFDNPCYSKPCFSDCWYGMTRRDWNDDKETIAKYISIASELSGWGVVERGAGVLAVAVGILSLEASFIPGGQTIAVVAGVFRIALSILLVYAGKRCDELQKDLNNLISENSLLADYEQVKPDLNVCKARCCFNNPSTNTQLWRGTNL